MSYIEVENLNKTFVVKKKRLKGHIFRERSEVEALKDVSFSVEKGELLGCIGPNGAGKSTTVKILSGILVPDSGRVSVDGKQPWKQRKEHVANIGVVFGQRMQLWWDVPVIDSFNLLREIYSIPQNRFRERLSELTEKLELADLLARPLRLLSLGQRMRCELAGSLLHSPGLLFLDEPTIGLDAVSKIALRDFLKRENKENGTTILLTTHDMEDISALCKRVLVLGHGTKLFDGAFTELIEKYDRKRIIKTVTGKPGKPPLPGNCYVERNGNELTITYNRDEIAAADVISALQAFERFDELTVQPQNIDEIIAGMFRELNL